MKKKDRKRERQRMACDYLSYEILLVGDLKGEGVLLHLNIQQILNKPRRHRDAGSRQQV